MYELRQIFVAILLLIFLYRRIFIFFFSCRIATLRFRTQISICRLFYSISSMPFQLLMNVDVSWSPLWTLMPNEWRRSPPRTTTTVTHQKSYLIAMCDDYSDFVTMRCLELLIEMTEEMHGYGHMFSLLREMKRRLWALKLFFLIPLSKSPYSAAAVIHSSYNCSSIPLQVIVCLFVLYFCLWIVFVIISCLFSLSIQPVSSLCQMSVVLYFILWTFVLLSFVLCTLFVTFCFMILYQFCWNIIICVFAKVNCMERILLFYIHYLCYFDSTRLPPIDLP